MRRLTIFRIVLLIFLMAGPYAYAAISDFDLSEAQVELSEFLSGGPEKDGIPSLTNPAFIEAKNATFLKDSDLVVGIIIDKKAKAYPIKILNWHEIVNDQIGKKEVAVTWCPLTKSAITFDRKVQGETLEFGVSGLLYNSNVVMYDRNHDGLWSQMKNSGLTGKHASSNLEMVPSVLTTWSQWRKEHPQTLVLSKKTGYWRDYSRDPYKSYHQSPSTMFSMGKKDERLPQKSIVIGIRINDIAKAYPLKSIVDLDAPLEDNLGGQDILVHPASDGKSKITDKDGNILPAVEAYWFAWCTFNKDTLIYKQ